MNKFIKLLLFISGFCVAAALVKGSLLMAGLLAMSSLLIILSNTDGL